MSKLRFVAIFLFWVAFVQSALSQQADYYAPQNIVSVDKATYKTIRSQFRENKTYILLFHYDKCTFAGFKLSMFKQRLQQNSFIAAVDSCYFDHLLQRYEDIFYTYQGALKFIRDDANSSAFTIHITLDAISENAGIQAKALLMYHDSIPIARFDVSMRMDDGIRFLCCSSKMDRTKP
mgnify:CR=1 FL=1